MDTVIENHCRNSYERLLLQQPHIRTEGLWKHGDRFFILCPGLSSLQADNGKPLNGWFQSAIKVAGAPVILADAIPDGAVRVLARSVDDLAQARGDAITVRDATADLALALPVEFPTFVLSDAAAGSAFTITVPRELSEEEQESLQKAYKALAISDTFRVAVDPKLHPTRGFRRMPAGDLDLVPSKFLPSAFTSAVRWLIEADEEGWRANRVSLFTAPDKAPKSYLPNDIRQKVSRCLVDAGAFPPANLRTFLPMYRETVIAMPFADSYARALQSFNVSEADLLTLAESGHVRFVLPQSVDRYPASLVNAVAERSPNALLFSRTLAAATAAETRRRIPLLFPPIGVEERYQFLSALHDAASQAPNPALAKAISNGLRDVWDSCDSMIARRGAHGVSSVGAARVISAAIEALSGRNLALELGHAAGYVEWAAALGATAFPVQVEGYSEQRHAELCASIYSGVENKDVPVNFGAVDVVLTSILGIANDAPVTDIVSAFTGADVDRLRGVVTGIAETNLDPDFLAQAVAEFNDRVRRYEKHTKNQSSHDVVALAGAVVPLATHHPAAAFASFGAWVLNQLFKNLPGGRATDWIRGVNAWSRPDVVLVSRLRRELKSPQ